jgi:TIR domain/Effector-associated domain 1
VFIYWTADLLTEEANTMSWEEIQRTLRLRLAELFPREGSSRPIVRDIDSTLETVVIWHGSARDYWSDILSEVRKRRLELKLIEVALEEYPHDNALKKAKADFQTLTREVAVSSTPARVSTKTEQPSSSRQTNSTESIKVFISYSEEDEKFKKQLETHLSLLRREKLIDLWNSKQTTIGVLGRDQQIAEQIDSAQIILLLMSPNFIASDQLYENEMMRAIDRQKAGDPVRVIPISVRPIDRGASEATHPFQKIQGLPRSGKPVESWRSADEAWALIAGEIREVCKDLRSR